MGTAMTRRRMVSFGRGCETSKIDCNNGCTILTILLNHTFKKKIYLFLAVLGLCCYVQAFSSCGKRCYFLVVVSRLCSGFSCHRASVPGM